MVYSLVRPVGCILFLINLVARIGGPWYSGQSEELGWLLTRWLTLQSLTSSLTSLGSSHLPGEPLGGGEESGLKSSHGEGGECAPVPWAGVGAAPLSAVGSALDLGGRWPAFSYFVPQLDQTLGVSAKFSAQGSANHTSMRVFRVPPVCWWVNSPELNVTLL